MHMSGSGLATLLRTTRLLVGLACLALMATSFTSLPTGVGQPPTVAPTPDVLDPCAGPGSSSTPGVGTPEMVTLGNFLMWSRFPARDVRARTIINDGSFARV